MERGIETKAIPYWHAVFLVLGTIIGAGIFAVPYVVGKTGVLVGTLHFLVLGTVVLLTHLFFGEIVSVLGGKRRFVGFAAQILGKRAAKIVTVLFPLSAYGALLSYVLLGGIFLETLFGEFLGGEVGVYQLAIFVFGALAVLAGTAWVNQANFWLSIALLAVISVISFAALQEVSTPNLTYIVQGNSFAPFGVILFSLLGLSAIPEAAEVLGARGKTELRHSITAGTLIAVLFTYLFAIAIVGLNGPYATQDAILGASQILGPAVRYAGALMGFLAVITSLLVIALNLQATYRVDFKAKKIASWLLTFAPVLALFIFGARDLIRVISITGSIFGGLLCIATALMYLELLKKKTIADKFLRLPRLVPQAVIAVFLFGVVTEAILLFS